MYFGIKSAFIHARNLSQSECIRIRRINCALFSEFTQEYRNDMQSNDPKGNMNVVNDLKFCKVRKIFNQTDAENFSFLYLQIKVFIPKKQSTKFFLKATDAVLSRNSPTINDTTKGQ